MYSIAKALKPYGYDWLVSFTAISGPTGSKIVVFATEGDFMTACLTYKNEVVWVMTCDGKKLIPTLK